MLTYTDENRGKIQFRDRKRQLVDFSGVRYGKITPSDIDGFFEMRGRVFVFYEIKACGSGISYGQRLAFERLIDALDDAGRHAILFLCWHNVRDADTDIYAADALVHQLYWRGSWRPGRVMGRVTLKQATDRFIHWAQWTEAMRNRNASCGVA